MKIAVIYSYAANEEEVDGILDEENPEDTSALDQNSRDFLESAILDYNRMFHINYDTSSDKFQNYYKDVTLRMKNKELDLLIVVNMFLTGFDATTLNTLWVDKNLKMHGLIQAFSRTNRILNSIKKISYDQDIRVEDYPFAREAVREAIYNAIAHNCYMYGTPIQIKITEDEMTISNRCILPENWTVETLMEKHDSIPYNPEIANVFYRAGFIENWGQGIQKICDGCKEIGAELPVYELTGTTLRIRFKALEKALIDQPKDLRDQADTLADTLPGSIITLIKSNPHITQGEMAEVIKVSVPSIKRTMKILSDSGKIVRKGGKRYGRWEVNEDKENKNRTRSDEYRR